MLDINVIITSWPEFLRGIWLTLHLVVFSLLAGFVIALPLAVARSSSTQWLNRTVGVYTYLFRGTPMLLQLLLIYYGLAQFEWMRGAWESGNPFWLLFREPYFCAWLAFALNTAAYTTEILAGVFRNTPHGEIEAGRAMGMDRFTLLRRIIIPAGLRRAIPTYSNEVILMLQGSAIASAVTLVDLTGAARNVYSRHFAPFEAFLFAGLVYMLLTLMLVGLFRQAENRWLAHLRPRSAQVGH
jgi:histidine transport system permease protein/arginine/ornithine transport system permease protein